MIWDLQVHEEKLVKKETWDKKVNQEQKEALATQATRVRKDNKV